MSTLSDFAVMLDTHNKYIGPILIQEVVVDAVPRLCGDIRFRGWVLGSVVDGCYVLYVLF